MKKPKTYKKEIKDMIFKKLDTLSELGNHYWRKFLVIVDTVATHQRSKLILTFVGFSFGLIAAYFLREGITLQLIKIILTPAVIFTSVLLAARQFLYTREWNQKNTALQILYTSRKETSEAEKFMRNVFDIPSFVDRQKPLAISDIHNAFGVFLEDCTFVYHGAETTENKQNIHTLNNSDYVSFFDNPKDEKGNIVRGKDVAINISKILNEYEYIALGCRQGAFDTQTVVRLAGPRIVTVYNLYINYIYHLRFDSKHLESKTLYKEIELLAIDICKNYKEDMDNLEVATIPREEDYKSPFED